GDLESAMNEWSFQSLGSYPHYPANNPPPYNDWVRTDGPNVHSNDASAYYAASSSGRFSTDITNEVLQTPVFSTIGFNSVSLKFYHHYQYGNYNNQDSIRVQVSDDYGANWS